MFKISFFNTIYYLLVKYIVFFFILAFIGNRFKSAVIDNAETTLELAKLTLGYILYVLFYVGLLILFFCGPLYYILQLKNGLYCVLLLIAFYVIEFFIYWYFFSPSDKLPGIYNTIIGIVFLNLFFYKQITIKLGR
jgi:hypothetical protein